MARQFRGLSTLKRAPEILRCIADSPDWPELIPGYLGLTGFAYPRDIPLRSGLRLTTWHYKELITAWIIFFGDEYPAPSGARVIVDAGANIGAFSLYAAQRAPGARILALEPFPTTFDCLIHNVRQNGLEGRIVGRPVALAGHNATRSMEGASSPSHVRSLAPAGTAAPGPTVEAVTLETLMARENLTHVDLLKLDIEGAEWELFDTCLPETLERVRAIALEYHPAPGRSRTQLFSRLEGAGFRVVQDRQVGEGGVAQLSRRHADGS